MELDVNLPTGQSDVSLIGQKAQPNPNLVSESIYGKGFNIGGTLKHWWRLGDFQAYLGGGIAHNGSYNGPQADAVLGPTDTRASSGVVSKALIGGIYNFSPTFRVNADLAYLHNSGYQDHRTDALNAKLRARWKIDRLTLVGSYALTHNNDEYTKLIELDREEAFRQGIKNILRFQADYKLTDAATVFGFAEADFSGARRSVDPNFLPTDQYVKTGGGLRLSNAKQTAQLEIGAYYLALSTEGFALSPVDVDFTGFTTYVTGTVAFNPQ